MLINRLVPLILPRLRKAQFANQRGRSALDALFLVLHLIEMHHDIPYETLEMLFVDVKAAFPTVTHEALRAALIRLGVHGAMLQCRPAVARTGAATRLFYPETNG